MKPGQGGEAEQGGAGRAATKESRPPSTPGGANAGPSRKTTARGSSAPRSTAARRTSRRCSSTSARRRSSHEATRSTAIGAHDLDAFRRQARRRRVHGVRARHDGRHAHGEGAARRDRRRVCSARPGQGRRHQGRQARRQHHLPRRGCREPTASSRSSTRSSTSSSRCPTRRRRGASGSSARATTSCARRASRPSAPSRRGAGPPARGAPVRAAAASSASPASSTGAWTTGWPTRSSTRTRRSRTGTRRRSAAASSSSSRSSWASCAAGRVYGPRHGREPQAPRHLGRGAGLVHRGAARGARRAWPAAGGRRRDRRHPVAAPTARRRRRGRATQPGYPAASGSLYARLGGVYLIALFADRLIDALLSDSGISSATTSARCRASSTSSPSCLRARGRARDDERADGARHALACRGRSAARLRAVERRSRRRPAPRTSSRRRCMTAWT